MLRVTAVLLVIALMLGLAVGGKKVVKSQLNRGIRNNNPLNIRISGSGWTGKVTPSQDKEFETFSDAKWGFRAAAKLIRNYQNLYGLNTLQGIINRWAPSHENNTSNYVSFVSGHVGISPNQPLNLNDDALLAKVVHAMSIMEVGRYYSVTDAAEGVRLA